MDTVDFRIEAPHGRKRLRTPLRPILVLPWTLIENLWSHLALIFAIIQWFAMLITGRRKDDIQRIQEADLGFASRVDTRAVSGTRLVVQNETPPNRLSNFFRLILAIPAIIVAIVFSLIIAVLSGVVWLIIIISGKMPAGLRSFLLKLHRSVIRSNACLLLMTDRDPAWS